MEEAVRACASMSERLHACTVCDGFRSRVINTRIIRLYPSISSTSISQKVRARRPENESRSQPQRPVGLAFPAAALALAATAHSGQATSLAAAALAAAGAATTRAATASATLAAATSPPAVTASATHPTALAAAGRPCRRVIARPDPPCCSRRPPRPSIARPTRPAAAAEARRIIMSHSEETEGGRQSDGGPAQIGACARSRPREELGLGEYANFSNQTICVSVPSVG